MTESQEADQEKATEVESCLKGMTRKEFMKALVKKSVAAGALLTAISAVEKFDMPAAYAATAAAT